MGNKTLGLLILAAATASVAFFSLRDTSTPSVSQDPAARSSAFESQLPGNTGSTMSDVEKVNKGREDRDVTDNNVLGAEDLQEKYAKVSNNPDYPQLEERLEAMQERHPGRSFDPEKVVEALARTDAWAPVETPFDNLPLTPEQKSDGREFIRFDPLRIESLMPGDTLEIPIWQLGTSFEMRVDSAEIHQNGSVTWHGHLENFTEHHRVIITVGEGLSVGGIDTPDGHYVLQANGESGWIASSETLFKHHGHETDMVIPPQEEMEKIHKNIPTS